jgi:hypothetical protein
MACSRDRPCCNRCGAGSIGFSVDGVSLKVTRGSNQLQCAAGNECDEQCDLPTGDAIVTGVLLHQGDGWGIDVEELEHRVGACTQTAAEIRPSQLSPTDQCDAKFVCDDGQAFELTCDGENDGSHHSLCACKIGKQVIPLPQPVRGEAPRSCDYAALQCLEKR